MFPLGHFPKVAITPPPIWTPLMYFLKQFLKKYSTKNYQETTQKLPWKSPWHYLKTPLSLLLPKTTSKVPKNYQRTASELLEYVHLAPSPHILSKRKPQNMEIWKMSKWKPDCKLFKARFMLGFGHFQRGFGGGMVDPDSNTFKATFCWNFDIMNIFVRSWPKALIACAVPMSQELG